MREGLLVGDGDEIGFIREVERVFAITFTEDELMISRTMGDIETAVARHLAAKSLARNRCASALAFYALRRALHVRGARLQPSTPLASVAMVPRQVGALIAEKTGMAMRFPLGMIGRWGLLFSLIGFLAAGMGLASRFPPLLLSGVATFLGGIALSRLDRGDFGHVQDVGTLAREFADQNFGHFIARGARFREEDVWRRLQDIAVSEVGGNAEDVARQTLLIQPRKTWLQRLRAACGFDATNA